MASAVAPAYSGGTGAMSPVGSRGKAPLAPRKGVRGEDP